MSPLLLDVGVHVQARLSESLTPALRNAVACQDETGGLAEPKWGTFWNDEITSSRSSS